MAVSVPDDVFPLVIRAILDLISQARSMASAVGVDKSLFDDFESVMDATFNIRSQVDLAPAVTVSNVPTLLCSAR